MSNQTAYLNEQKHFGRYLRYRMKGEDVARSFVGTGDGGCVTFNDFRNYFWLSEILSLYKKRNGRNGKQYRIVDLFGNEMIYIGLLNGANVFHEFGDVFHVDWNFLNTKFTNLDRLAEVFPNGLPKNRREVKKWYNYITWLAHEKYGKKRKK